MKKIFLLLTVALFAAIQVNAMPSQVVDETKISEIVSDYYPHLKDYYDAGLLYIDHLNEETLADGRTEYNIRYKFVKNYYGSDELDGVLRKEYPVIWIMNDAGIVKNVAVYRYVDKETGEIKTNVTFDRNYRQPRHQRWGRR